MLLIDCHEPKEIIDKLVQSITVQVLMLKYGDYSFSDIIIERKTLSDFFSSLKGNRLKEQMESMSRFYTEKYLIIEGFFDFSYVNNLDYLYSKLAEIILNFDVHVLFSKDQDFSAELIRGIYSNKNLGYVKNIKRDKIYHAVKFFGIGRRKLDALFQRFAGIRQMAKADKKDFRGIKHVGKKSIEKINNLLDENIFWVDNPTK